MKFNERNFAKENNLGEPVAASFYQAQFDDYVPVMYAELVAAGWVVLRFSATTVLNEPDRFVSLVRRALESRGRS